MSATARTNRIQMEKLIEALQREPDIAHATYQRSRNRHDFWEELAKQLNYLGPPVKHHFHWKKVWFDFKCSVRKKMRLKTKALNGLERKVAEMLSSPTAQRIEIPLVHSGDRALRDIKIEVDDTNNMIDIEEPIIASTNDFPIRRKKDSKIEEVLEQNRELVEVTRLKLESEKLLVAAIQQATKANERVAEEMQKNNALLAALIDHLSQDAV
uniref:Regulatory protein zeste n=1 Tax=Anopheles atroparvus TaxID=41427 RepID=A0AAG5DMY7_ANOAO